MKTILAAVLGCSLMAAFASQSSAAAGPLPSPHDATANPVVLADYDDPAFGTRRWWQQQEDRGG
jgi:hypothetical protein